MEMEREKEEEEDDENYSIFPFNQSTGNPKAAILFVALLLITDVKNYQNKRIRRSQAKMLNSLIMSTSNGHTFLSGYRREAHNHVLQSQLWPPAKGSQSHWRPNLAVSKVKMQFLCKTTIYSILYILGVFFSPFEFDYLQNVLESYLVMVKGFNMIFGLLLFLVS